MIKQKLCQEFHSICEFKFIICFGFENYIIATYLRFGICVLEFPGIHFRISCYILIIRIKPIRISYVSSKAITKKIY